MIKAQAILPARFDPDAFSREIIKEAEKLNVEFMRDFNKTVDTWNHKPVFKANVLVSQDLIVGHVRTAKIFGEKPAELIYYFISEGTKVRFAKMTPDFEPKTRVRVLDSFPGAGGLDSVDVRFPMPGIQGRKFNEAIADKHRARMRHRMLVAITRGVKASGHAYK